ncbi:4'-phosphopantetheinyl transferase [Streptomyces sp. NPDC048111]|uniref:4'-phosphopantetheinyl transferase family protein n=1 Tax=Streptomyces sp. NPDC048111 TaxID=3365500 RepID=UPI0037204CD5
MIEALFPHPATATAEHFGDTPDGEGLFPQERALVAGVGAGRRREFTTVRHCARAAMAALGAAAAPLLPDEWGAPRWPPGIVGSMTHCRGYRAAVVARATAVRALGLDAEPHRPLRDGVLDAVATPRERAALSALAALDPSVHWDRLLFCAKEATFKAWFPEGIHTPGPRPTSFHHIEATLRRTTGTFHAVVLPGRGEQMAFEGVWGVGRGVVVAGVGVPASSGPRP